MEKSWAQWADEVSAALISVSDETLRQVAVVLADTDKVILVGGNGGSSALASHAAQALLKPGYKAGGGARAICLTDNTPALTAHANDGGWDDALLEVARPYLPMIPTLVLISSSGNSKNLVKLAEAARGARFYCPVIAFTGFDGGRLKELATLSVHVPSNDYEVVEPVHDALLHRVQYHLRGMK